MQGSWISAKLADNWPIKVTALIVASILWAVTEAEEPTTQLIPVAITVTPPEGRALTFDLPPVQALFAGPARELIQLFGSPPKIRLKIPDTVSTTEYTFNLTVDSIQLDFVSSVQAQDLQPRKITVQLDDWAQKTVPVVSFVQVIPEAGYQLLSEISYSPNTVVVTGPRNRVERIESISTETTSFRRLAVNFERSVNLDTTDIGVVRLSRYSILVSGEVGRLTERVLTGVPIVVRGDPTTNWVTIPPAISVTVRGPAARLSTLSSREIQAIVSPRGIGEEETTAISILGPAGLEFEASPDSAIVQSRDGA
jgi:hypothetical protein